MGPAVMGVTPRGAPLQPNLTLTLAAAGSGLLGMNTDLLAMSTVGDWGPWGVAVSLAQPCSPTAPLSVLCLGQPCHLSLSKRPSCQGYGRLEVYSYFSCEYYHLKRSLMSVLTAGHCSQGPRHTPLSSLGDCCLLQHGAKGRKEECQKERPICLLLLPPQGLSWGWGFRTLQILGNIDRVLTPSLVLS